MDLESQKMLIDGELVSAEAGREYDNVSPIDESTLGTAPDASATDVERAVLAARRAFDDGRWASDVEFRRHCLEQLQERLRKNVEPIREVHTAEVGMPVALAHGMAVDPPIEWLS